MAPATQLDVLCGGSAVLWHLFCAGMGGAAYLTEPLLGRRMLILESILLWTRVVVRICLACGKCTIRRYGIIRGGIALLEVCHCGGRDLSFHIYAEVWSL